MKTNLLFCLAILLGTWGSKSQNLPENPNPGKCYVKCITKDEFKEVEESIIVSPEYEKIEVVPATYKFIEVIGFFIFVFKRRISHNY